jgi:formate hydrogenlyase subunit 4
MLSTISWAALALVVYPGFVFAIVFGLLCQGLERKVVTRAQSRAGQPLFQPFRDLLKLLGKSPFGASGGVVEGLLPVISIAFSVLALAFLPLPGNPFPTVTLAGRAVQGWDLLVVLYLLEMPSLLYAIAGYASRSIYGQIGASRRVQLIAGYGIPYLVAAISVAGAVKSFNIGEIAAAGGLSISAVKIVALVVVLFALPGRLGLNPFSQAEAEVEVLGGPVVEYSGRRLALFRVARAVDAVAAISLVVVLFAPQRWSTWLNVLVYLAVSVVIVAGLGFVDASTIRLRLDQALKTYWIYGLPLASLVLIFAVILGGM